MRCETVRGVAALSALAREWWCLFRAAPSSAPFQSPAWLLPWSRHLGPGDILAVQVRKQSELVGLAPFSIARESDERVLRPLGSGVTDICDGLAAAGCEREVAASVLTALMNEPGWDRCDWDGLPPASPFAQALEERLHASRSEEIAPVLAIAPGADALAEAIPRGMAVNLQACRKRAERMGGLRVRVPAPGEADRFLDCLFALHAARWRSGGEQGVLGHASVQAFHRETLPALIEEDLARVHLVEVGGRVAAAHYGFAAGRTHYYYIGGFDPELRAAGPGHLAIAHAIERAIAERAERFHFLRGDEPYKRRWGAEPTPLATLSFRR
jgi:CelD/BcsL family acetyltransferase involved in cellulose biosynthesis